MKHILKIGGIGCCWVLILTTLLCARAGYHQFSEEYQEDEWYAYNTGVLIHTEIAAEDFDQLLDEGPQAFEQRPTRRFGHDEANNAERVGFTSRHLASEPYIKVGENFGEPVTNTKTHQSFATQIGVMNHHHKHKQIDTGRYKCTVCKEVVHAKKRGGPTFADMSLKFKGGNGKRSPRKSYPQNATVAKRN